MDGARGSGDGTDAPILLKSPLALRIVSALVMAPVAIAAVWFGGLSLVVLTSAAAAIMGWEWARLCRGEVLRDGGAGVIGIVCGIILIAVLGGIGAAMAVAPIGALAVFAMARGAQVREAPWLAIGTLWIALPCILFLWLAGRAEGRELLLWMLAIVWVTDIGAYAAGRTLGGPRLAPRWSPRKTWAGLIGGILCAGLAGWVAARLLGLPSALPLVLVSAGLAIIGQFGDLAESMAKRRFGVKDTSGLIPGHGGLLDRLDGLLAVIPAVALLTVIGGGSVLSWR